MAVNLAGRGGACPFLSQPRETPTWARIVDTADETCSALDLSEALTEVFFHECGRHVGGVPRSFFSTSADAVWAECPGHH